MKIPKGKTRTITVLTILAAVCGLLLGLGFTEVGAATPFPVWVPPQILLPYVGDMPGLCVNPLDSTISYLAASGGNGEVSGSEGNNWLNGTYTKLNDRPGTGGCAFDEFGTMHVVWSYRGNSGTYNFYYNSVQKGAGNVPLARNLTQEIYSKDKYTLAAHIAVSVQQKKVFIVYQERGEGGDPLMFIESGTQGDTWSKPVQLGVLSGYRPAESDIIVDKQGLPHVFYGVFREGGPSIINHRMRLADGRWTPDENITGDDLSRPIWTQAELDPTSGDIYVSWVEGQTGISRWDAATGKWSHKANISNSGGRAFWPTIAVNSQTGVVWDIWVDEDNIWSRQSTDHGQTWREKELVVNLGAAKIGRMFGLKARSTRGIIYLLISADQLDPLYYVGPTLSLMTFNQSIFSQPVTPTLTPTAIPPTTATVTISVAPTVAPSGAPQPTTTPAPTATPAPPPTATAVPATATATPKPTMTASPTAQPVPAQAPGQGQPQSQAQNQPAAAAAPQTQDLNQAAPDPTNSPKPAATIAPEVGTITAQAEAQRKAAATPHFLVIPAAPSGSGGKGPALVLPTSTPLPTFTAASTAKVTATATTRPEATVTVANTPDASRVVTATTSGSNPAPAPAPTVPPSPGAFWLLPLGLVVGAKGFLNLFGVFLKL